MGRLTAVLTEGEWLALLAGTPDQYQHLVRRLAVAHGALPGAPCPSCGGPRAISSTGSGMTENTPPGAKRASRLRTTEAR